MPSDYWHLGDAEYHHRARAVFWHDEVACRAPSGYCHGTCILPPGHNGDHEGAGYDEGGPKPMRWPQTTAINNEEI